LHWDCLLIQVIAGMIEGKRVVTGKQLRRRKQLPYDLEKIEDFGN